MLWHQERQLQRAATRSQESVPDYRHTFSDWGSSYGHATFYAMLSFEVGAYKVHQDLDAAQALITQDALMETLI